MTGRELERHKVGGNGRASGVPQAGALRTRVTTLVRSFSPALLLALFVAPAHAFTIKGQIVNGTTGESLKQATVAIVNPSDGMTEEREVEAQGGRFEAAGLDDKAPLYLVRVDYDGVPYNIPVQVDGTDKDITVTVYESTSSWDGIKVTSPHLAASWQGDHLSIEQLFEISNESSPPRTAAGAEGYFKLFIPAEMESLTTCFVTSLGVPVDRTPMPTDEPNVFRVEYPIRPGLTRIGIAYKVPYAGQFTLNAKVLYDLEHVFVFAVDPEMQITSPSHTLQPSEPVHGMTAYSVHGVPKGSVFTLAFSGGTSQAMAGQQEVHVIPNEAHRVALYAMIPLLLVLLALVGVSQRTPNPLADTAVLKTHYDLLVKRLARLDDLRAADAISDDAHRAARDEMTARLGALAVRLRALTEAGSVPPPSAEEPAPDPESITRGRVSS
ncbi:MAG TPA: hypothetical protein VFU38_10465 [Candidatus Krumholzibacteria bacterium]|nr:hypothetical protein [Candidatus Krumholzibacteria bacterium]